VRLPSATHLVVLCWTRAEAERALARLTAILADLGLEPKAAKTRIVHLAEGGEGFDFLGFQHRFVCARGRTGAKPFAFLARWPSRQATQQARDRIRELTARSRLLVPPEVVVQDVNAFLRGWVGYFRIGNSTRAFDKVSTFAVSRMARFVAKVHRRSRSYGWSVMYHSANRLGLINLNGLVVAPRPNRSWRALLAEHRR
jgi:RNA-directed DNA polymerase